ncbi:FAD-dependent monooxygenase [Paraburkholderia fungorum]|uniref:FAD-dependent monooxygenase n=1 Tax=Paraburkholderia fungorum TaxID=134537 RepID=UPI0038B963BF
MTSLLKRPVLVVGAGPTGLTLALLLRRHGIDVRIIDHAPGAASLSKALAVWSASLEVFASIGVVEEFLSAGNPLRNVRFGDNERLLATIPTSDGVDSAFPQPILLPQSQTEEILRAQAVLEGIHIEYGVELVQLAQNLDEVTVTLNGANGDAETACFDYVVGADGARSAVRHALSVDFEGYTEPETYILGDVRITGGELDANSIYIWWHDGGTIALFPIRPDVWRVMGSRPPECNQDAPTLEELQEQVTRHGPPGLTLDSPGWLAAFATNERLAAKYCVGRVFLAGDAAHIHSPAGGQGMNTGIQDAANLAWKLAFAVQGRGHAELLLSSYEAERRPVAKKVVGDSALRLHVMSVRNPIAIMARDVAVSVVGRLHHAQRKAQVELSETDVTYKEGHLVELGGQPRHPQRGDVGTRALNVDVPSRGSGVKTLWSSFDGMRHLLLVFASADDFSTIESIVTSYQDHLRVVSFDGHSVEDQAARDRYRMPESGWVLIRPDMVVAARGLVSDVSMLHDYLDSVTLGKVDA